MKRRSLAVAVTASIALVAGPSRAQAPAPAPPAAPSAAPAPSPAPDAPKVDVREAEAHFHRGVELYKESDYGGALVEFKRAYEIAPNYRVLYNLGQTYFQLQRWAEALEALQDYLTQGGAQIAPEKRASVESDVRQLENRIGQVEVKVNLDGAQIMVDDQAAGTSPLAQPIVVSVGHRKVSATKAGLPEQERFLDVAAGDHATVELDFPPPVAAAPAPRPAPAPVVAAAPPPPPPEHHSGKWIAWGIAAGLGAATAVTGVLTLVFNSSLSKDLNAFPGDANTIHGDRTNTQTFGVVTDALIGATVVAGGIAIVLTATDHAPKTEVGFTPGGVQLRGSF